MWSLRRGWKERVEASSLGWEEGLVDLGPLLLVSSLVLSVESEMELVVVLLHSCGVRLAALVPTDDLSCSPLLWGGRWGTLHSDFLLRAVWM